MLPAEMADDPDPPRKFYGLKSPEFDCVNTLPSSGASASPPNGSSPTEASPALDAQALARIATRNVPLLSGNVPSNRPNEIHAMLQENLARADAAGLNELKPLAARPSRRRRDFRVLLVTGNLFLVVIYCVQIFVVFQVRCLAAKMPAEFGHLVRFALSTPQMYALPLLGIMFFSASLSWLMFGVMDDY